MEAHFWSGESTLIPHVTNPVNISAGGGAFALTVLKGQDDPLEGVNCYLFTDSGTYLAENEITSSEGEVTFYLADGSYKIRVDHLGYQFWTDVFTVPTTLSMTHTIAHQDVTVTVQGDYGGDVESRVGLNVYLFTPAGSYLGIVQTTDALGQITFNLPEEDYKVRADYLSQQYWSEVFNWTDEIITINEGMAEVHVTSGANPLENVPVYVFTALDSYLGINDQTDADGIVNFRLPETTYKFRADHLAEQYWATEPVNAHQVNVINVDAGGGSFTLTVEKAAGVPMVGIPVYVFTSGGSYLGMTSQTDSQGQVSFDLSDGDYKFRADYLGYQFWSDVSVVPTTLSDVLTISHQDVTITVESLYLTPADPVQGVRVYLFKASGSYLGKYADTDAQGQVTFSLPQESYKVRADYMGYQFWSEPFVWSDTPVTINHGLAVIHVTQGGADVVDAPVYLFKASGSYLGKYERTDVTGIAEFLLPDQQYKFRVDYEGTQYWSDVVTIIPHEENNIELNLDLLALDLTNDPNPVRYNGTPPTVEPKKVLVASLIDLPGLLVQSVVSQIPEESVHYYVNDHLGTPQKMIDQNGVVVWDGDYEPFGEADVTVNTVQNNFRFPGQYHDTETGLHYNYYRCYNPSVGRYLTPDPLSLSQMQVMGQSSLDRLWQGSTALSYIDGIDGIENLLIFNLFYRYSLRTPQALNLHVYVANNPINSIDRSGLLDLTEAFVAVERAAEPYVVGGALVVTGGVTFVAGAVTTVGGYGSIPKTGPAGFLVGNIGALVAGTGVTQVALGLDVYADELRRRFDLPGWFDVWRDFEFFPHEKGKCE
jgi:RHS repeat-associated protein